MKNLIARILTSIVAGGLFLFTYSVSVDLFCLMLGLLSGYIIFVEWPPLMGGIKSIKFWLISPFYPILPIMSLIFITYAFYDWNWLVPLYPFLIAWGCDIASYFTGKLIGKHKIVPTISPGKTWEGLAGGFVAVFVINFFAIPNMGYLLPVGLGWTLGYAVVGTTVCFLGDIFVSFLKRRAHLKDTGAILPGHGGLLDRADSVMFMGMVTLAAVLFLHRFL